jgi:hypothetical protein
MDMRNPYGAEGGYVTSSRRGRRGRRDRAMGRGMDYAYGRRYYRGGDYEHGAMYGDRAYSEQDMARGRRDYESMGQSDMGYDDIDMRRRRNARGQYMSDRAYEDYGSFHEERGFRPVEAMGYFTGYYGGGQDMARGGRRDYNYDMGYDMRGGRYDYGYDYAGDYGENLTREELEHWKKKLTKELDEKDKQFFSKENITNKAKQMGINFDKFTEEELEVATMMVYTDYCKTLGTSNMDLYLRLAKDWLEDEDVAVKGGEKLAIYHDCIVEGE